MPVRNDHWAEVDHLRKVLKEQLDENARLGEALAAARLERDDAQLAVRTLRAENERALSDRDRERQKRWELERQLYAANQALAARRKVQEVGVEMAMVLAPKRGGGKQ